MKVLFVYRGYGHQRLNSVVDKQIESLVQENVEVLKYHITKGGALEYIKNIKTLRRFVYKNPDIQIVHAHFNFSGFLAALAIKKLPVVCSLMGSDVYTNNRLVKFLNYLFSKLFWDLTIVKSKKMQSKLPISIVIPNGINLDLFKPQPKKDAQERVNFNPANFNIIFVTQNPNNPIKNLPLAEVAINLLDKKFKLHIISNISEKKMADYFNAADALLLTSLSEGSPNVVKEAMACNCPVVSTDVGDVKELFQKAKGYYISTFNPEDIASLLEKAVISDKVQGREAVKELGSKLIAIRLINQYNRLLSL